MCEAVERYAKSYAEKHAQEYAEKYAEEYAENKQLEMIKNLMDSMKLTAEQAMAALKLPDKEKAALMERL